MKKPDSSVGGLIISVPILESNNSYRGPLVEYLSERSIQSYYESSVYEGGKLELQIFVFDDNVDYISETVEVAIKKILEIPKDKLYFDHHYL